VISTLWFIAQAVRRDDPLIKTTFDLVRASWRPSGRPIESEAEAA
jgi:hypothetical protein